MKNKIRNKKGFTLIELIVVIAVLGVLVLMAAPKFLGYITDAKLTQIKADIKTYENAVTAEMVRNENFTNGWSSLTKDDMESYGDSGSLMDKDGKVKDDYIFIDEEYLLVPKDLEGTDSNLDGDFIIDSDGEVYYYEDGLKIENDNSATNPGGNNPGAPVDPLPVNPLPVDPGTPVNPLPVDPLKDTDGDGVNDRQEVVDGTDPQDSNSVLTFDQYLLTDSDFDWVEDEYVGFTAQGKANKGYFVYNGTGKEIVKVPEVIQGHTMTSYQYLFENKGADVKKVVFQNPNVTTLKNMFNRIQTTSLDLSHFNTSHITNMDALLWSSKVEVVAGLENWDTSNVTGMSGMFGSQNLKSVNVINFNTSNVRDMSSMFSGYKGDQLDLSSFDTSKVTNFSSMFKYATNLTALDLSSFEVNSHVTQMFMGSSKLTTVYARTPEDATKLSDFSSYDKPMTFNVIVKTN